MSNLPCCNRFALPKKFLNSFLVFWNLLVLFQKRKKNDFGVSSYGEKIIFLTASHRILRTTKKQQQQQCFYFDTYAYRHTPYSPLKTCCFVIKIDSFSLWTERNECKSKERKNKHTLNFQPNQTKPNQLSFMRR